MNEGEHIPKWMYDELVKDAERTLRVKCDEIRREYGAKEDAAVRDVAEEIMNELERDFYSFDEVVDLANGVRIQSKFCDMVYKRRQDAAKDVRDEKHEELRKWQDKLERWKQKVLFSEVGKDDIKPFKL